LFIAVDDMRPTLGAYNFSLAHTPNMDKLASEGVTFKRAYVQYAVCSPSRNSFLSGRRPDTTQVWTFSNSFRDPAIGREPQREWQSLPGYFREHGYLAFGSGKLYHPGWPYDNDYAKSWSPEEPYFSPECQPPKCPSSTKLPNPVEPKCKLRYPKHGKVVVCAADVAANETRKMFQLEDMWIRDNCIKHLRIAKESGKNFFVGCGFHRPHIPWTAPAEFWDYFPEDVPLAKYPHMPTGMPPEAYHYPMGGVVGFDNLTYNGTCDPTFSKLYRRAYYASVAYTDYNIGVVLDELEALGLKDDTAVLLFGDHGWHLGEFDVWAKLTNFELGVRIPMILRAPWIETGKGMVADALTEAVDFYPTLVELAGLPDPRSQGEELNGTSLVPVLTNPSTASVKKAAFSQIAKRDRKNPTDANAIFNPHLIEIMGYSVRVQDWRYTAWFGVTRLHVDFDDVIARELYSHVDDDLDFDSPAETVNVVDDPANKELVEELHKMIVNYVQIWPGAVDEDANITATNVIYT